MPKAMQAGSDTAGPLDGGRRNHRRAGQLGRCCHFGPQGDGLPGLKRRLWSLLVPAELFESVVVDAGGVGDFVNHSHVNLFR